MLKSAITILIALMLLTISFICSQSIFGEPETSLVKAVPNPNSTKKAVLLENDGGTTVDISLQVSILDFNTKLNGHETGNTFSVDRNHGATGLDSNSIKLNWTSNDTLEIAYDQKLRTFIQQNKVNNVTVIYKPK